MKNEEASVHSAQLNPTKDYSPSSTLIVFENPLPLLRLPTPASSAENKSDPLVLAFENRRSFESALKSCYSKIIQQCEDGTRIGCAIAASSKCRPPMWRTVIGKGGSASELRDREMCEERETRICMETSREECCSFALEKCLPPFRDAHIAIHPPGSLFKRILGFFFSSTKIDTAKLVGMGTVDSWMSKDFMIKESTYRGRDLLDSCEGLYLPNELINRDV